MKKIIVLVIFNLFASAVLFCGYKACFYESVNHWTNFTFVLLVWAVLVMLINPIIAGSIE